MRPFWRSFWASIFAYVVLSAFIILIINIVVFTVAGSFMSSEEFKISENSYLEMDLNFNIKERGGIETTNDTMTQDEGPFTKELSMTTRRNEQQCW